VTPTAVGGHVHPGHEKVAEQLGEELAAVYQSRRLARAILCSPNPSRQQMAEIKALTSTIDASAGVIQATATILRAL
jgi:hypothetical protein